MTRRRLFLALLPGPRVQADLQQHLQRWHWPPGLKTTPPDRFHLTLHFLGEVDAAREQALVAALPRVTMRPMQLHLDKPELWRSGVAVLQPRYNGALDDLHRQLAGLVGEAPDPHLAWKPHVTLARHAGGAIPPEGVPPVTWTARRFYLAWSERGLRPNDRPIWGSSPRPVAQ